MKKQEILQRQQLVRKLGEQNKTPNEITKILNKQGINIIPSTVRKYLKMFNISLEGSGGKNRIVNNNPFLPLTSESYYWLGMLAADGWVANGSIRLKLKDIDYLLKYRDFINPNLKPFDSINQAGNKMRLIYFGNKEVAEWLDREVRITPNKSRTLCINPDYFNNHFIRGYFDGDGTARKEVKITTGSICMRNRLLEELTPFLPYSRVKGENKDCFDVIIRDKKAFFDYLYQDADIYLERKYEDYVALIGNNKKKIT